MRAAIPEKEKKYVVDEMVNQPEYKNIELVRLPPYHCEFNPIEKVWARAKTEVAKRNLQYKLDDAMKVMKEETLKCDAEYWVKLHRSTVKEEKEWEDGDAFRMEHIEDGLEKIQVAEDNAYLGAGETDYESDYEDSDDEISISSTNTIISQ